MKRISLEKLSAIEDLFNKKKWKINQDNSVSLFHRYCSRFGEFDDKQQNFFYDLTLRFKNYDQNYFEKIELFWMSYYEFVEANKSVLDGINKIIFLPLVNPFVENGIKSEDTYKPKAKSGDMILADLHSYEIYDAEIPHSDKFYFCNDGMKDFNKFYEEENSFVIFVDDYIGSGGTAVKVINKYIREIKKLDNVAIITLVSQKDGIKEVWDNANVKVYSYEKLERGISDYYPSEEIEERKKMIKNMGKKIGGNSNYYLGYKNTEALLSLYGKSPNNTFSIFWHSTSSSIAPFPRDKNIR